MLLCAVVALAVIAVFDRMRHVKLKLSENDDFEWQGVFPEKWIEVIEYRLAKSNWRKNPSSESDQMVIKIEDKEQHSEMYPADQRSWEVFSQELLQAGLELAKKEAPLKIGFMSISTAKHVRQIGILVSFAQRNIEIQTKEKITKKLDWAEGQKILKSIYSIDYPPEQGTVKVNIRKTGGFISPGDGSWYPILDQNVGKADQNKREKLNRLLHSLLP